MSIMLKHGRRGRSLLPVAASFLRQAQPGRVASSPLFAQASQRPFMAAFSRKLDMPLGKGIVILSAGSVAAFFMGIAASETVKNSPLKSFYYGALTVERSVRDVMTLSSILRDYHNLLTRRHGLLGIGYDEEDNGQDDHHLMGWTKEEWDNRRAQYEEEKKATHERSAAKLRELCLANGGFYVKLGQILAQLEHLIPLEYVEALRPCMDRARVSPINEVRETFREEFGKEIEEVFEAFDPTPIASASLAQVHVAHMRVSTDGRTPLEPFSPVGKTIKVAVKVQHRGLKETVAVDIATLSLVSDIISYFFPQFSYKWIVNEVRQNAPKELDFKHELRNAEETRSLFSDEQYSVFKRVTNNATAITVGNKSGSGSSGAKSTSASTPTTKVERRAPLPPTEVRDQVRIPDPYWPLCTSRLITMSFEEGCRCDDVNSIKAMGLDPQEVSALVAKVFSEMIFIHGFVHCDPHAANMLVRRQDGGGPGTTKKGTPVLVLLDHGLYRRLEPEFRLEYSKLWKSLIMGDEGGIKAAAEAMNAGASYPLFASMLTTKSWDVIMSKSTDPDRLKWSKTAEDLDKTRDYAAQYAPEIMEILNKVPRSLLLLLKTTDCLRAVDFRLGGSSQSIATQARYCEKALSIDFKLRQEKEDEGRFFIVRWWHSLKRTISGIQYSLRLKAVGKALKSDSAAKAEPP
eukprot:CAMPEP_0113878716 /NCGR_PEP_ID=MMETSP0780_2-20120614/6841_1 /TAXON_ID=652834 /ORGANISM="Palpitomonas bilix" /LENGTH=687 /DNA_ID=CAMNT_0000865225 /DNA_START=53 /DNA_END=2113 /DNA_ORIENTATION=- /assembly_acc=CAM_ASM_000599